MTRSSAQHDLLLVVDNFITHVVRINNFQEEWQHFMRTYLASIASVVGAQALLPSSSMSSTANVPTSFIEELEALRLKVDQLDEEVCVVYNQEHLPEA